HTPARAHVEAAQIEDLVDAQRGLPDRRRLERRADQVDVAGAEFGALGDLVLELLVRIQAIDVGQIRAVRADAEAAGELRQVVSGRLALERARQVAGVRVGVRNPDVGRTALEATEAAVDGQAGIRAPVEAEARLQDADAVQVGVVAEAEAVIESLVVL